MQYMPDAEREKLLEGDHMPYLAQDPGWTPTLTSTGIVTMTDLLKLAGVLPPLS